MPLEKRRIEPCELSRKKLENGLQNELEAVAVNTLCGIMRQLSSLSKHAEDVFGELFNEANGIYDRTNSLHERVQNLALKVTQLDSTVEEISLQEINKRKPFKSTIITDQQVLSSNTMPRAMIERYGQCDEPPRLSEMNSYRDDNKDALKFYTDPKYFFELWCEEMRKETEYKKKKKKRGGRARAGTREKKPVKAIKKKEYSSMGAEFQQTGTIYTQSTSIEVNTSKESVGSEHSKQANGDVQAGIPNHVIPQHVKSGSPTSKRTSRRLTNSASNISRPSSAPPPPPPAPAINTNSQYSDDFLPPPPEDYVPQPVLPPGVPPPPPPPPPPPLPGQMPQKPMPTSSDSGFSLSSEQTAHSTSVNSLTASENSTSTADTAPVDPKVDGRSDLLAAIRTGMELRKVQVQEAKKEEKKDDFAMDVASILARRIAVEYSSDEESETGSEWDSEGDE